VNTKKILKRIATPLIAAAMIAAPSMVAAQSASADTPPSARTTASTEMHPIGQVELCARGNYIASVWLYSWSDQTQTPSYKEVSAYPGGKCATISVAWEVETLSVRGWFHHPVDRQNFDLFTQNNWPADGKLKFTTTGTTRNGGSDAHVSLVRSW
jgi:hypothetical protein